MSQKEKSSSLCNCKRPPEHTYFRKGRWVYYPQVAGQKRIETSLKIDGKLLREDSPCHDIHAAVSDLINPVQAQTIKWLLDNYLKSDRVRKELARNTVKGYAVYYNTLVNMPLKNGKTFGDIPFADVTPGAIRSYLDKRKEQGSPIGGNREVELLSASYSWAFERDIAERNPCKGVRHNSEVSRTKYITDAEFNALLKEAQGTALAIACEIAYLCRARGIEAWNITLDDIDNDVGVFVNRTKGSLSEWTTWTPRLRSVIDSAIALRFMIHQQLRKARKPIPPTRNLLITRAGVAYTKGGVNSAWRRAYAQLVAKGLASDNPPDKFSFHDIKAKGVSDHARHESGHKSEKAKAIYMRKIKEVEATK